MRPRNFALALFLPLLAACGGGTPPATPAATAPVEAPAAPAPAATAADLGPVLGTWADDPASCGTAERQTTITATHFEGGGKSCDVTLAASGNGDVTGNCGELSLTLTALFAPSGEAVRVALAGTDPVIVYRCQPAP